MFEELEKEERGEKEERNRMFWITAILVGALLIVGAIVYIASRGHSKVSQPVQSVQSAAGPRETAPDPVKDLKIISAVMGKDPSGIRVMWSVQIRNKSAVYTYSDIQYEARFVRPDGTVMAASRDTLNVSFAPGEEKKIPPFMDGLYDARAAAFQFVLLGAKSATQ
ncbi:MAG: hypothetical protein WAO35_19655 [Terriglobia bacterium]